MKKTIYIIGALLVVASIPVFFLSNSEEYSKLWSLFPLSMGVFIILYNKYNKVV